ncbi:hypothetical protein Ancab_023378 [Ancistrocladus abbreviatus]
MRNKLIAMSVIQGIIFASIIASFPIISHAGPTTIPAELSAVEGWFRKLIKPLSERKATLDPALVKAEGGKKVIKVGQGGEFKTVTAALKSIKPGNTNRVIIQIGPGEYKEKIKIERSVPYITLLGDPKNKPTLTFGGTAAQYGTVDSATLIVESDYFVAANLIIANSAPRPDGKRKGAQALAVRISGEKAAFYNCRLLGFQDTLCDDKGSHFFKDCYIEGTVDFIFGDGRSIYMNTEIHVIPGDPVAIIAAQAGKDKKDPGAYVFVHGRITGTGGTAILGRAWMPAAKVIYAFTTMSDVVKPEGWSDNFKPENQKTVYFGEYQCKGLGAKADKRVKFAKVLTEAEVQPYISLDFLEATKWLLPLPTL